MAKFRAITDDSKLIVYSLMNEVTRMNVPIIFKGSMVLNVLAEGRNIIRRETHDFDADFLNKMPDTKIIVDIFNKALLNIGVDYIWIDVGRNFSLKEEKSLELRFKRKSDNFKLFGADIYFTESTAYSKLCYGQFNFYGQNIEKTIAEKISVISTDYVYRRVKDIIDLYIISYIWSGDINTVRNHLKLLRVGKFNEFLHDYNVLCNRYINDKHFEHNIEFKVIYNRVYVFIKEILGN